MKILTSLIAAAALLGSILMFQHHRAAQALREAQAGGVGETGFADVPPPIDQDADKIYVVAAQNCPRAAAQQADRLAKQLGEEGIPVVRTHEVLFHPVDRQTMERLSAVMKGPLPLVFIHGRAASNPELAQVVAEYGRSRLAGASR
jgi:hypothetical protein